MKTLSILTTAVLCVLVLGSAAAAEEVQLSGESIKLWPEGAPGATGSGPGHEPDLSVYLPTAEKATGVGIVVCPGGGYGHLALGHEGEDVAQWLVGEGIAAFVLRYRHAPKYHHPAPLLDAQRALRTVRARAEEWAVAGDRIGMLGFSAGGHLTATAGTQFAEGNAQSADPIERVSCRPDFLVLVYPVISTTEPYSHAGSRRNLLGKGPAAALVESLSAEKQVSEDTPPAFIISTHGDTGVPAENSVAFFLALRKAKVPAELHVYEKGPHGFGLAPGDPVLSQWPGQCIDWLRVRGILR